jgi:hypothetical protein
VSPPASTTGVLEVHDLRKALFTGLALVVICATLAYLSNQTPLGPRRRGCSELRRSRHPWAFDDVSRREPEILTRSRSCGACLVLSGIRSPRRYIAGSRRMIAICPSSSFSASQR